MGVVRFFILIFILTFNFIRIANAIDVTVSGNTGSAIQTAINQVHAAGVTGTVNIPAGTYTVSATINSLGGINIIGAGQDKTFLVGNQTLFINDPYGPFGPQHSPQVVVSSPCRISGISFQNTGGNVTINSVIDFRLDHCTFNYPGTTYGGYLVDVGYRYTYAKPRGVIDHCTFYYCDYAVHLQPQLWEPVAERAINYAGTANTVFIEDCYFDGHLDASHAVSAMNGSHYVVRHSTIMGFDMDMHGPGYEYVYDWKYGTGDMDDIDHKRGGRCEELYANVFIGPGHNSGSAMYLRANSAFMFNNYVKDYAHLALLETESYSYSNNIDHPHDVWIWNNTLDNSGDIQLTRNSPGFLHENVDYFLRAPDVSIDSFTYTPFPYPHYLVTGDTPPVTYNLTTAVSPSGGGTVSGGGNYTAGTSVTVTATPVSGYTFTSWSGGASGTVNQVTVTINSNLSVTANFNVSTTTVTYTLITAVSPTGVGIITLNPTGGTYAAGTTVTLTATPASYYVFTSWIGGATGTSTQVVVTMDTDKIVTATFVIGSSPGYRLTTTIVPIGAGTVIIVPSGTLMFETYVAGTSVQVTATANSGYTFISWTGDATGTTSPTTIVMDADKTVTANFSVSISTETTEEISEVKACPNPFIPSINANLEFKGTTAEDSEVRIYSVSGELVRAITKEGSTELSWDGKNEAEEKVSGGIYVYVVNGGEKKFIGRIAVIR